MQESQHEHNGGGSHSPVDADVANRRFWVNVLACWTPAADASSVVMSGSASTLLQTEEF
jgi:hypothetical protein